jgi:hypothetical protein
VDYFKPEENENVIGIAKKQAIVRTILQKHNHATNERRFNALFATGSINEAIDMIVDMCLPLLRLFYPELEYRNPIVKDVFWFKPELSDVSLTINQITDGWYQCIRYALGYNWYAPSLNKEDIVRILKYPLHLYGPYFDVLYYSD